MSVQSNRPNIIYIHSHDTGRHISPYGHAVHTPNLQRLAEQGVLFRQAFDAAPTCSPARACLLAGQWAHCNGMEGLAHRGWKLNDYSQHIVHTMRKAGYVTALAGIQHEAHDVSMIGYDQVLDTSRHESHVAAVNFLRDHTDKPFFLSVGFGRTHRTGKGGDGNYYHNGVESPLGDPRYVKVPAPLPDNPRTRQDMADFNVAATKLDQQMGAVFDAVEKLGLAENTLIIATTDHGIAFPGMKCNLTDHGIGVMLIMRGPGGFVGGKVLDSLVSHIDLFPTICEVAGIDKPAWLQGRSVLPLVRGDCQEINDAIFAEVNYHASYEPKRAVRTARYKYIRNYGGRGKVVLPNCDDGLSKDVWMEAGWLAQPVAEEMLFDLVFDPNETNNLIGQPHAAAALAEMRGRLDQWMRETNDPLLKGAVPRPAGAVVNDVDAVSPRDRPS